MELYLNCASDWSIQDDKGKKHSLESAKKLYESGKVADSNLAFMRLVSNGFDIEATKASFK